jgi:hypothetical protein
MLVELQKVHFVYYFVLRHRITTFLKPFFFQISNCTACQVLCCLVWKQILYLIFFSNQFSGWKKQNSCLAGYLNAKRACLTINNTLLLEWKWNSRQLMPQLLRKQRKHQVMESCLCSKIASRWGVQPPGTQEVLLQWLEQCYLVTHFRWNKIIKDIRLWWIFRSSLVHCIWCLIL